VNVEERWRKFWKAYRADLWEPETKALLEEVLEPGDLFLDLGAWIGPVSLWALDLGASVIAVEPDPVALRELHRTLGTRAEIWEVALGTEESTLRLAPKLMLGDSMSHVSELGIEVPSRTLPEIVGNRRPKLAVMDVEGYELTLLPTVAPYLGSLGCALMVALHTKLPDLKWFRRFSEVEIPETARNAAGRSLSMVARP
jgi:FkbM family methyltransferase